jgi:hypothetical protein
MATSVSDTPFQARARSIMGKNFLGIGEVMHHFGVKYTAKQIVQLAMIPFDEDMLCAYKDTHVLVAGAQLSVNDIHRIAASDFYNALWYNRESFANDKKVSVRWYLLRKEPVPESLGRTYNEQVSVLKDDEVPFACEMTYMVILYWLTHRVRLLADVFVRCQDQESNDFRIIVGGFNSDGIAFDLYWDEACNDLLGLASSVLPPEVLIDLHE